MSRFIDKKFDLLEEYVPGEQPQDGLYIKLNTNESPYPPSEGVVKAVSESKVRGLNRYNDPDAAKLRKALADLYGVDVSNVFLSNGSDNVLNMTFMAYGFMGAVYPDITYGFYKVLSDLHGVESDVVPLKEDFTVDVEKFKGRDKLVAVVNPNAPTGLALSMDIIEDIVKSNPDGIVLVDEAYADFAGESCYPLIKKYDNLICVGTFSKSRNLAGGRLGFAIADKNLVADLEKIKNSFDPYYMSTLTQVAGIATIEDNDYYMETVKKTNETKAWVTEALTELGFEVIPSKTNFILAKTDKIAGAELYNKLKDKKILVRHFDNDRIKEYNRISIGTDDEMKVLLEVIKEILQ